MAQINRVKDCDVVDRRATDLRASDRGATMVEFSIAGVVAMLLIGAVFDLAIGLYQYSMLTYVVSNTARSAALDTDLQRRGRAIGCNALMYGPGGLINEPDIELIGSADQSKVMPQGGEHITFSGGYLVPDERIPTPGIGAVGLVAEGQARINCFFTCSLWPDGIMVRSRSSVMMPVQCS